MARDPKARRGFDWEAPLAMAVIVIVTAPVIVALGGAFWLDGPSLKHLHFVFGDLEWTWQLVRNSAAVVGLTTSLAMTVAVPLGFLLFRTRLPGRRALMVISVMAAAVPVYVVAGGWATIIGNETWSRMDHWWQKVLVASAIQAIAWLPWATMLSGIAFRATDTVREEQGLLDARVGKLFLRVCIPDALRGLAAVALLVAAFSLADVTITDCIGLNTLQQECYSQFRLPAFDSGGDVFVLPNRAAAVAIPYTVAIVVVGMVLAGRLKRQGGQSEQTPSGSNLRLLPLSGTAGKACIAVAWVVPAVVFGLPTVKLILLVESLDIFVNTWRSITSEIKVTVLCASATAVAATILGSITAMVAVRKGVWSLCSRGVIVLLIAIPAPLAGISIAMALNNDVFGPFYDTPAIYVYGMTLRCLPFAALIMIPEIARLPRVLREQSQLDGCSRWRFAWSVILPNLTRGLATSAIICMILSIGELGCAVIIQSPGYATLSIRFFTMIHNGMDAGAAALALAVSLTIVPPAVILIALLRRIVASD